MNNWKSQLKYLKLLSKQYPSISSASAEIINLEAVLSLPKGTEHFLSDLHGE
ncbi:MAG: fructose-bisphosphatase class III [Clostridioides difficile]